MNDIIKNDISHIMDNKIPESWRQNSFSSLKPLGSYLQNLKERSVFIHTWISDKEPTSFWCGGFFNPSMFFTSVLQNYSRRTKIPFDQLTFGNECLSLR